MQQPLLLQYQQQQQQQESPQQSRPPPAPGPSYQLAASKTVSQTLEQARQVLNPPTLDLNLSGISALLRGDEEECEEEE